jgi:hypothetical protein
LGNQELPHTTSDDFVYGTGSGIWRVTLSRSGEKWGGRSTHLNAYVFNKLLFEIYSCP